MYTCIMLQVYTIYVHEMLLKLTCNATCQGKVTFRDLQMLADKIPQGCINDYCICIAALARLRAMDSAEQQTKSFTLQQLDCTMVRSDATALGQVRDHMTKCPGMIVSQP